jgi:hypothetical protein
MQNPGEQLQQSKAFGSVQTNFFRDSLECPSKLDFKQWSPQSQPTTVKE